MAPGEFAGDWFKGDEPSDVDQVFTIIE